MSTAAKKRGDSTIAAHEAASSASVILSPKLSMQQETSGPWTETAGGMAKL
jgi:hypothetical protein